MMKRLIATALLIAPLAGCGLHPLYGGGAGGEGAFGPELVFVLDDQDVGIIDRAGLHRDDHLPPARRSNQLSYTRVVRTRRICAMLSRQIRPSRKGWRE